MVELTSLIRESKSPHLKVVLSLTDACSGRCRECYVPFGGRKTFLDFLAFKENILPYLQRVSSQKPHITFVGGEPCLNKNFLPMTEAIIDAKPQNLDIYTNGALFAKPREEFWRALQRGGDSATIVFSYDRHHLKGVPGADGWLDKAFQHFAKIWSAGSKTGFIISSTRFCREPEAEIEDRMHSLAAEYGIPIKTEALGWENVFSWAGKFPLRIEVPQFGAYFELLGRRKHNGTPIGNENRLAFSYQSKAIYSGIDAVREDVRWAEKQYYKARQYPFFVEVVAESKCAASPSSLEFVRFLGTDKKELLKRKNPPKNQLYINHDGEVYENPIALAQGKKTGFSILIDPLDKIAELLYPQK